MTRREAAALALVVVLLHAWTFGPMLGFGFTDADAWADVAWARHPLAAQLLTRLTGGVAGDDANFWRPAAMVQFWVQRRLFGWNAVGWQAWDLALHTAVTLLAGRFVYVSAARVGAPPRALTWAVTLLFGVHPLTEDVVPAVARNLDLLLGLGVFGALVSLEAALRGRRAAWVTLPASVVLALGAKETGVLLLPLSVVWVLLFCADRPWNGRLRIAAALALPLAALVGLWLGIRGHVLGGLGGYYGEIEPAWIRNALARAFIEPFLPSVGALFPRGAATLVPLAAVWALTLRAGWRSPHRALVVFGALWFLGATMLYTATGTCSRRVYYVPTLAGLLTIVPAVLHAWRGAIGGALSIAWVAATLHGTPALLRYHQWPEIAAASEMLRDEAFWRALPEGADVWLLERPFRADLDPRTFSYWGGRARSLHHGAPAYALQAWLDEVMPERRLSVATLTGTALVEPVAAQRVAVEVDGDTLVVTHAGADRQRWDVKSPFVVVSKGETVRVTPRRPRRGLIVVIWTERGLRAWVPGTGVLSP